MPAELQEGFRIVRQHTVTPLAVGEVFNTIWDTKTLIEEQLIDYIRATVVHAGGVTHLRRIADFAAIYQIRTGFHGAMDMSPVCLGACLHLDLALPNFGIQEYSGYTEETLEVLPRAWSLADGYLHPGRCPRARRRHRRGTCPQIPLPARLPAGEPARRRHALALVNRHPIFSPRTHRNAMKITAIRPLVAWVGTRNQLLVKVETDEGVFGWGESGLSGREKAVAGAVEHYAQFLVGKDPMRSGALWQEMYRSQYFEGGRVLTAAISAIDIALTTSRARRWACRSISFSAASSATASRPSRRPRRCPARK